VCRVVFYRAEALPLCSALLKLLYPVKHGHEGSGYGADARVHEDMLHTHIAMSNLGSVAK
jgi:hypothetical protein